MIQCMFCGGEYKQNIINKKIQVLGLLNLEFDNLEIYICDRCGREIYPPETIKIITTAQNEYFTRGSHAAEPVFI